MKSGTLFFLKASLLGWAAVFAYVCLFIAGHPSDDDAKYMYAIIDKHRRADSLPPPRILLFGGSNLAFGVDTKRMQDSLRRPVANLGLHAGLGLDFILKEAALTLKPGDRVVLSTEHFLGNDGEPGLKKRAVEALPALKTCLAWEDLRQFYSFSELQKRTRRLLTRFFLSENPVQAKRKFFYERKAFNNYGDISAPAKPGTPSLGDHSVWKIEDYSTSIRRMNQFAALAKKHGANVCYVYPPLAKSEYLSNQDAVMSFDSQLRAGLEFPILGRVEDFIYPDSLFFNTVYHLNSLGAKIRTEQMIELLRS